MSVRPDHPRGRKWPRGVPGRGSAGYGAGAGRRQPPGPKGDGRYLAVAAQVIESWSPRFSADRLLRDVLRAERGLDPETSRAVAQGVFAYFRWLGWLNTAMPLVRRVMAAIDLEKLFVERPESFQDQELVQLAVPDWIRSEVAVDAAFARSLQQVPALWIRTKRNRTAVVAGGLSDTVLLPSGRMPEALEYRGPCDLFRTELFQTGEFEIQDLSSQAVGLVCAPQAGETWWDACAGEGGKTLHLSDLMANKGLIWATDRAEWRLRKLRVRAARAKAFNYRLTLWDGGSQLPTKTRFCGVLVDAPCSGVGTWGRNPDARWSLTGGDVKELAQVQSQLLHHAACAVKPGGRLVYSVCTLTRSETTEVASAFEGSHPEFRRLEFVNPLNGRRVHAGRLELLPAETRGNGMFIAGWLRNGEASRVT